MPEKDDKTGLDWSQATDEELAKAAAEAKTRRPLTDFEGIDWPAMNANEFENKSREVFRASKKYYADQALEENHADMVAEKEAQARRAAAPRDVNVTFNKQD